MNVILVGALVTGAVYSLAAMGLVLTYRVSGVFNFAHGAMGMFVAYSFWHFQVERDLPVAVALVLALGGVAPLMALVFERVFRPLRDEAVVVQVVASLGLLVFLQNLAVVFFGRTAHRLDPIFPQGTMRMGDLRVGYDQIGTVLLAVVLGVALTLLLRRTRVGRQMRAVVDNDELAEFIGVSANRVARLSWIIGAVSAGLAGILLSPFIGLQINLLTILVIATYAAAMFGRLESLPLAWAGGLTLALAEHLIVRYAKPGSVVYSMRGSLSFLLLFALLILYRDRLPQERRLARVDVPPEPLVTSANGRRSMLGLAGAGIVALPFVISDNQLFNVNALVVTAVILTSLVVLSGLSGQISLCQASFMGIGGITAGHLAATNGSNWLWAVLLAALIAAPVGAIVGLPSLRLSGMFLALATMAFALLMDNLVFGNRDIGGGEAGLTVATARVFGISIEGTKSFYFLAVPFFVGFAAITRAVGRGRIGRRLTALRDSPDALTTLGANLVVTRLLVFALSASMAAAGGALFAAYRGHVSALDFQMFVSVGFLVFAVIGGIDSIGGAVIAALALTFPQFILQTQGGSGSNFGDYFNLGVGLAVVQVARYPNGAMSLLAGQVRGLSVVLRPRLAEVEAAPA